MSEAELVFCLKLAMKHWAGWADESRGEHPSNIIGERSDWVRCELAVKVSNDDTVAAKVPENSGRDRLSERMRIL